MMLGSSKIERLRARAEILQFEYLKPLRFESDPIVQPHIGLIINDQNSGIHVFIPLVFFLITGRSK
jgi:hypothetical protein